jgi:hypothetical protein
VPGIRDDGDDMRLGRPAAIWTVAILVASALLGAAGQQPLPAFSVLAPGGGAVASPQLSPAPQWVLLYVTPGQRPCDDLLETLAGWQLPPARIVVIARASLTDARTYVERASPAVPAPVTWYADANDAAWQALQVRSTPMLMGVRDGALQWTISGVLNDPSMVEPVIRSWVRQ